jgi:hypothetical protein
MLTVQLTSHVHSPQPNMKTSTVMLFTRPGLCSTPAEPLAFVFDAAKYAYSQNCSCFRGAKPHAVLVDFEPDRILHRAKRGDQSRRHLTLFARYTFASAV